MTFASIIFGLAGTIIWSLVIMFLFKNEPFTYGDYIKIISLYIIIFNISIFIVDTIGLIRFELYNDCGLIVSIFSLLRLSYSITISTIAIVKISYDGYNNRISYIVIP